MTELDYQEIITLSEDPDVSFDDVRGQPFTTERHAWLAQIADSMFSRRPLDKQVGDVLDMPIHISVRRLERMSTDERSEILSRVPSDLADRIVSRLPARAT